MKYLSAPVIHQLATTTPPSSDIKEWINYLLYNKKIIRRNNSADINAGNYDKVFVPLGKIANT